MSDPSHREDQTRSWLDGVIRFCLENQLVVGLSVLFFVLWGVRVAPFDWEISWLPRVPVATDAIPDIGENQQIVFTEWPGRSPQDIEDQVTYPLTVSLLGVPSVKTIRSYSLFGFSSIYVIFEEGADFYWARARVLEKLNSLSAGTLPEGVQPALGPDATGLGQVFWYTLEGQDEAGQPAGGWDLQELRSVQDWYVRYALLSAEGISEVASIGGYVKEYQVDVNPDAMRANGVRLDDVFQAVRMANIDVGARSIEVNRVEYFIRGLGFIKDVADLEASVVKVNDNVPIYVKDVARVTLGPALRRGALDKGGIEAVGGVAVVRYGHNPLAAIKEVKRKIEEIRPGLPEKVIIDFSQVSRAQVEQFAAVRGFAAFEGGLNQTGWKTWLKTGPERPPWLTVSKLAVVPFYDRTGLINETLETLNQAITLEILITVLVILVLVRHLASSALISGLLPLAVLMTFIAMSLFGVDANVVALSGIAIAIGTLVDVGIIVCDSILNRLNQWEREPPETRHLRSARQVVFQGASEVGSAVLTAVATTVVGFLPVFAMEGAEGKLFKPLAFTKTFALVAAIVVALTLIPAFAQLLFAGRVRSVSLRRILYTALALAGLALLWWGPWWAGTLVFVAAIYKLLEDRIPGWARALSSSAFIYLLAGVVGLILAAHWLPLGPEKGLIRNALFVGLLMGGCLFVFWLFRRWYPRMLRWAVYHKAIALVLPLLLVVFGAMIWLGFERVFGWLPGPVHRSKPAVWLRHEFAGLGKEFMPPLDEGSYLFMPITMFHASIGEALDVLHKQDAALATVPEIDLAVGKLGRAESALDPAPISMFETVVSYKPQYLSDESGRRLRFRFDPTQTDQFRDAAGNPLPGLDGAPYVTQGKFARDNEGKLIPDDTGWPFRLWRPALDPDLNPDRTPWPGITTPTDIWNEILSVTALPGTTSAPKLQPIAARLVMLQSGMRAPMGVKVKGPDLQTIDRVALQIEQHLKKVPAVSPDTVIADRIVGKPYLEIQINRPAIARFGLNIRQVQDVIEVAIGGKRLTTSVEGRERYPVRVRYMRELRDQIEDLGHILVPTAAGAQIPLSQLADIQYVRGPQTIKSEDTFLVGYVIFDMKPGQAEVNVVEQCQAYLKAKQASGELIIPPGVSYTFAGSYENQVRAAKRLSVVIPLALFVIFLILYLQFRSTLTALQVFSGVFVAWAGGFLMIWCYGQPWFMDFSLLGVNLRDLFQMHTINLSVAVWVGFLALFGIATDDGVLFATILDQTFGDLEPNTVAEIREAVVVGATRRVRAAVMTSATTILALFPVLTSNGRGSDIMVPMAVPSFGGMAVAMITAFVVPILYCQRKEWALRKQK